jgi:hypothetical protein
VVDFGAAVAVTLPVVAAAAEATPLAAVGVAVAAGIRLE